ncbi:hypothetical protein V8G54_010644 [Vigna mungo]|uniref:Uncharacterized protein n=1 Tax=Vigna mungo TaxID=3915 RepID=A0AAQ3NZJ1_VIGMU
MEKFEKNSFASHTLLKYGNDLTQMAKEGKLDPVIGRSKEIERVQQILCKRRKNNPCLLGDPGVGKTVIAEGLAQCIVNKTVPLKLQGNTVIALEMGRLVAGTTYRGDFEERMVDLIEEVKKSNGKIILFIDELHTLIGAGSSSRALDAANILKPALARGEIKCLGATTVNEYRKYIKKDPALQRRFQTVDVPEPTVDEAIEILKGLVIKYEKFHGVTYEYDALVAASALSKQYISDGFLPDKAIDVIDEAGAKAQLTEIQDSCKKITATDIHLIISIKTGIPIETVSQEEAEKLLKLEEALQKKVVGQHEAVEVISKAIRRARTGMRDPEKPTACFLFIGPTGVGKTELVKALAVEYFGSKEAMIRFDMSEFMERHTVSKLIGSPPGYIGHDDGGQLTEAVRRHPHSLILFDEIEKAHTDVFNVFLQIMDDARLTDGKGQVVDFKNTVIIMTSNLGFGSQGNSNFAAELKRNFRDELEKKKMKLNMSDRFKRKLVEEGYNSRYGARPLKRAITRLLEDTLADKILEGFIAEGSHVYVDLDDDGEVIIATS